MLTERLGFLMVVRIYYIPQSAPIRVRGFESLSSHKLEPLTDFIKDLHKYCMGKTYKYNYFYKITNNINGHYYYGIHSTDNLDDGYMGSGSILNYAYKIYGIENFTKEIIKFFENREECSLYESQVVNKDVASNRNCYNVRLGGDNQYVWYHKDESRNHLRKTMTPQNSTNPRVWVCKEGDVKYIRKELLEEYILDGWELGRKDYKPRKGYNGVHLGEEKKIKLPKIKKERGKTQKELQHERGIIIREEQQRIRENRINIIKNSDINFKKFGWVNEVSSLINIPPQKVNIFMKKYMPDFYKDCFVRKVRNH